MRVGVIVIYMEPVYACSFLNFGYSIASNSFGTIYMAYIELLNFQHNIYTIMNNAVTQLSFKQAYSLFSHGQLHSISQ